MAITAALVKELRERTGAGMMECKKFLTETDGDIEAAIETMRKEGMAKADKKAGRVAAEGLAKIKSSDDNKNAIIVEVNSETDFVTKGDDFIEFVDAIADCILANKPADLETLLTLPLASGTTVEDRRKELIAKIGENMSVRRFEMIENADVIGTYQHGERIAVMVELEGGDAALGKDIAMHIAASCPVCVAESEVPREALEKEREIFSAQAAESGKPADIIEKMVEGRIKKFLKEVTLLGQPFVKNPDQTVEQLLKEKNATVKRFIRFEVGEGIEKKEENFADEVMAQIK
ncbi:MAG: translation elongation factor Ts [Gammaproteobacteria bacterium]|nr:translation elongation factor Ts [Gammaproteobacteria bacterium]MCW8986432.1 translation elongation factor Ts [Gammaproteobacteria bacterium]